MQVTMLETVVIVSAAVVLVALAALMFYVARQQDLNLQRRVDAAESGGRPLSSSESASVLVRGIRPTSASEEGAGGWYSRYRRRNALTRTHIYLGLWWLGAIATMVVGGALASSFGAGWGVQLLAGMGLTYLSVWLFLRVTHAVRKRRNAAPEGQ